MNSYVNRHLLNMCKAAQSRAVALLIVVLESSRRMFQGSVYLHRIATSTSSLLSDIDVITLLDHLD